MIDSLFSEDYTSVKTYLIINVTNKTYTQTTQVEPNFTYNFARGGVSNQ